MEDNNGRVTLAILKQTVMDLDQKIEHLTTRQEKLSEQIEKALHGYSERLRFLETSDAGVRERLRTQEKDLDSLSSRSNIIDSLVALATVIAGMLGIAR